ncbi:MAG: SDR family oxidoreductase [Polyangiaceae bacterium]|jgi:meso-butanediol dehydrogenase/(S,S)-butanediol dehydrogenase/diacetyl reductase|nr:SDR family oxidoreductase [Polyangiaceae bacterium]MBK8940902.1 SDR family oxidoreductase [Polyangiaceae bacterium]
MRLKGKIALVTGASRGIGRASALALAHEGATIVGVARTKAELDELCRAISASGGSASSFVADVTKAADVAAAVGDCVAKHGRIDILVNNVGMGGYRPFLEWSEADYDRIMATNAKSTWLFCKEVIPHMLSNGGGNIINVASVAGLQGYANEAIYCSSKFAQVGLTQALDREFWQKNIKVSAICPGGVETHFALGDGRTAGSEHMKGFSTAEDVAEAVVLAALPRDRSRIVAVVMRPMNEQT